MDSDRFKEIVHLMYKERPVEQMTLVGVLREYHQIEIDRLKSATSNYKKAADEYNNFWYARNKKHSTDNWFAMNTGRPGLAADRGDTRPDYPGPYEITFDGKNYVNYLNKQNTKVDLLATHIAQLQAQEKSALVKSEKDSNSTTEESVHVESEKESKNTTQEPVTKKRKTACIEVNKNQL